MGGGGGGGGLSEILPSHFHCIYIKTFFIQFFLNVFANFQNFQL